LPKQNWLEIQVHFIDNIISFHQKLQNPAQNGQLGQV